MERIKRDVPMVLLPQATHATIAEISLYSNAGNHHSMIGKLTDAERARIIVFEADLADPMQLHVLPMGLARLGIKTAKFSIHVLLADLQPKTEE